MGGQVHQVLCEPKSMSASEVLTPADSRIFRPSPASTKENSTRIVTSGTPQDSSQNVSISHHSSGKTYFEKFEANAPGGRITQHWSRSVPLNRSSDPWQSLGDRLSGRSSRIIQHWSYSVPPNRSTNPWQSLGGLRGIKAWGDSPDCMNVLISQPHF